MAKVKKNVKTAPKKIEAVKRPTNALEKAKALYAKEEYQKPLKQLKDLRKEGEWKVLMIKDENINIKINKQLNKEGRQKLLNMNKGEMAVAKGVAAQNKERVNQIMKDRALASKYEFAPIFEQAKAECKEAIANAKLKYKKDVQTAIDEYRSTLEKIATKYASKSDAKKDMKVEKNVAKISYNSKRNAAKSAYVDAVNKAKEQKYQTFQQKHEYISELRLNKLHANEDFQNKFETYVRNFNLGNWLVKNALIIIVCFVFLLFIIITQGKVLLPNNILYALTQIAPKMFFSLGVAGLILLGGTDLSIGRLTGVGASFTLMILTSPAGTQTDKFGFAWFGWINQLPMGARVPLAILFAVLICVLFTSISGFFTAKFKMHPFISTLAVQLIVFGFFQYCWSHVSNFTVEDEAGGGNIRQILAGQQNWLLIIYAVIAIAVVWFIWNKTKFGKHLYAVGGNQEAAAVSGISPFKITMLAFVMAGVLYGLGGFTTGLYAQNANFSYGAGSETDAIAACVIGGVSFSGGVGSVGGVVGGTLILGFLTYCFDFKMLNTNIQYIIKGIIILVAVTLDCMKYIRKK